MGSADKSFLECATSSSEKVDNKTVCLAVRVGTTNFGRKKCPKRSCGCNIGVGSSVTGRVGCCGGGGWTVWRGGIGTESFWWVRSNSYSSVGGGFRWVLWCIRGGWVGDIEQEGRSWGGWWAF